MINNDWLFYIDSRYNIPWFSYVQNCVGNVQTWWFVWWVPVGSTKLGFCSCCLFRPSIAQSHLLLAPSGSPFGEQQRLCLRYSACRYSLLHRGWRVANWVELLILSLNGCFIFICWLFVPATFRFTSNTLRVRNKSFCLLPQACKVSLQIIKLILWSFCELSPHMFKRGCGLGGAQHDWLRQF